MKDQLNRNLAYDILRIISAISIIVMHTTSGSVYSLEIGTFSWGFAVFLNSISHFGVPVFVMISGALFLRPEKEIDLKKLWFHNILRMFVVFLVWSFVYGFFDHLQYKGGIKELVWSSVISRNHLWFVPMIIGIYIITPILARWVKSAPEKEIRIFILSFFIFQILCETLKAFQLAEIIDKILEYRNIELVCSYVGYFIVGYYIAHIGLPKVFKYILYAAGICGCIGGAMIVLISSLNRQINMVSVVDSFSSFSFFYSSALFTFVYEKFGKKEYSGKGFTLLSNIAKDTFGLYLCHILIIERLSFLNEMYANVPIFVGIPVYTLAVVFIGCAISAVLRRIPFAGRYIC